MTDDRYDRQSRLPEVGRAGQARLASARVRVRGTDGSAVERIYLTRAGVGHVDLAPEERPDAFLHGGFFATDIARRFAGGAWRALDAIRRELGITR